MTYLVLSDIHANLEALEAVLAAAPPHDAVLMLGDLVGYGADPNAVVERIRGLPTFVAIRGNHDKVGAGIEDVQSFNAIARQAILWTAGVLTADNREWLAALPAGPRVIDDLVEICHGTPFDEDTYLFGDGEAQLALTSVSRPLCLFGHTHVPSAFAWDRFIGELVPVRDRTAVELDERLTYVVNCGAVGQPRDGNPRAAFGVVDTIARAVSGLRVDYDIATAQRKIVAAGLPEVLAHRLAAGR